MNIRNIIISINNSKVWLMAHGSVKVANHFNQEVAAETSAIQRLIQQIPIQV